jgi:hypothetical protein
MFKRLDANKPAFPYIIKHSNFKHLEVGTLPLTTPVVEIGNPLIGVEG